MKKIINPNLNLTLYTKINSKWIIDLNVRCRIIQLLEDHIGENLWELGFARVLRQSTESTMYKSKKKVICTSSKVKTFVLVKTMLRE